MKGNQVVFTIPAVSWTISHVKENGFTIDNILCFEREDGTWVKVERDPEWDVVDCGECDE